MLHEIIELKDLLDCKTQTVVLPNFGADAIRVQHRLLFTYQLTEAKYYSTEEGYYKPLLDLSPRSVLRAMHEHFYGLMLVKTLGDISSLTRLVYNDGRLVGIFSGIFCKNDAKTFRQILSEIKHIHLLPARLRYKLGAMMLALYFYEQEDAHDKQFLVSADHLDLYTFDYGRCGFPFFKQLEFTRIQPYFDEGIPFEITPEAIKNFPKVTAGFYWFTKSRLLKTDKGFGDQEAKKFSALVDDLEFKKGVADQVQALIKLYKREMGNDIRDEWHKILFAHYQKRSLLLNNSMLQIPPSVSGSLDALRAYYGARNKQVRVSSQPVPSLLNREQIEVSEQCGAGSAQGEHSSADSSASSQSSSVANIYETVRKQMRNEELLWQQFS